MISKFDKVVEILRCPSHNLKELAIISGRSPLRFFNSADLSGLDLSSQDLTGLNFDNADLRLSNLEGTTFDPGCFNNSLLDVGQQWLKDEFEFNAEDIMNHPNNDLLVFAQFRPELIDTIITITRSSFESFAKRSGASTSSVRKARYGKVVAIETAQSVISACRSALKDEHMDTFFTYGSLIEQPCVSLLVGGNNAPFRALTRSGLAHLMLIRKLRLRDNFIKYKGQVPAYLNQRDTAEYLRFFEELLDREDLYEGMK